MKMVQIDGVIIKKLKKKCDKRGWLAEIYRKDFDNIKIVMSYISYTKFNVARGPHEHKKQKDFFVFIGPGNFEISLWDNRKKSKTYRNKIKIIAGEKKEISVLIPPGVIHGYKSISKKGSFCINLPDKLYSGNKKKGKIDEIRYEENKKSEFKII